MNKVRSALNTAVLELGFTVIGENDDPTDHPAVGLWLETNMITVLENQNGKHAINNQFIGIYQISAYGYIGTGSKVYDDAKTQIKAAFKSGGVLEYDGQTVNIQSINYAEGRKTGAFYVQDISINFYSDLEN